MSIEYQTKSEAILVQIEWNLKSCNSRPKVNWSEHERSFITVLDHCNHNAQGLFTKGTMLMISMHGKHTGDFMEKANNYN